MSLNLCLTIKSTGNKNIFFSGKLVFIHFQGNQKSEQIFFFFYLKHLPPTKLHYTEKVKLNSYSVAGLCFTNCCLFLGAVGLTLCCVCAEFEKMGKFAVGGWDRGSCEHFPWQSS